MVSEEEKKMKMKDESSGNATCSSRPDNGGQSPDEATAADYPSPFTDLIAEINESSRENRMNLPLSSNYLANLLSYPGSEPNQLALCNYCYPLLDSNSKLIATLDVALDHLSSTYTKLEHMYSSRDKAQAELLNALMEIERLQHKISSLVDNEFFLTNKIQNLEHVLLQKDIRPEKKELDYGTVLKERDNALMMVENLKVEKDFLIGDEVVLRQNVKRLKQVVKDKDFQLEKLKLDFENVLKERDEAVVMLDEIVTMREKLSNQEESFCQKELNHKLMLGGVLESLTQEMNDRVLMKDKCNVHKGFSDKHHQQLEDVVKEHCAALNELDELKLRFKEEELKHKDNLNGAMESLTEEMNDRFLLTVDCKKQRDLTAMNQHLLEKVVDEHESTLKELERIEHEEPISITIIIVALAVDAVVCCLVTFFLLSYVIVS